MKRKIALILCLSISQIVFAQLNWGIYAGASRINFIDKSTALNVGELGEINFSTEFSKIGSINAGIYFELGIFKNMYFETGLNYSNKGFEHPVTIEIEEEGDLDASGNPEWTFTGSSTYIFTYKMPCVSVPTILNYYIFNKKFKLYAKVGQKLGLCFDSETTNYYSGSYSSSSGNVPSSLRNPNGEPLDDMEIKVGSDGAFKAFHYDMVLGGGIGFGKVTIAYTYDMGLLNASNIDFFDFRSIAHTIVLRIDCTKKKTEPVSD